jgi:MFS family permease
MGRRYVDLLKTPGALGFFTTAFPGRVGIAMTPLGLVWLVHSGTGSYRAAGLVAGTFAVAEAVAGPQLARLVDRHGQSRMLPWQVSIHALTAILMIHGVRTGALPWILVALGALMGASIPQLGALSAARWITVLGKGRSGEMTSAFSLESVANSIAYMVGPVVVSLLGAMGEAMLGTLVASLFILCSGVGLALQRRTAPVGGAARDLARPSEKQGLRNPAFLALVAVNAAIGLYFGAMQLGVTAFTAGLGVPEAAAGVFLLGSCAGVASGLVFGALRLRASAATQLAVVVSGFLLACVALAGVSSVPQLVIVAAASEVAVPPALALCNMLMAESVPHHVMTQAFTWANSASAAGAALAAAVGGWLVDEQGGAAGFFPAVCGAAVMALICWAGLRPFRRLTMP